MGQVFVGIKPFADETGTSYESDFEDITEYVTLRGLTALKQNLDNTTLDIGIFRHDSFDLELNNTDGKFSKPGSAGTLFKYTRANSVIRVTWEVNPHPFPLGFHTADSFMPSPKYLLGDFLLQDIPAKGSSIEQTVKFKCIGYSILFDRAKVPYGSISNGDKLSEIIYTCLNQAAITDHLTVNSANISLGYDPTIDDKTLGGLENETVTDTFKKLLVYGSAVLTIENADLDDSTSKPTVYVSPRTPSNDLKFTFTGPGSYNALENIIDIKKDNGGENKIINFVTIPSTSFSANDSSSETKHGTRKRSIEFKPITDQTKNETACQTIVDEFKDPLRELHVSVPMTYETLALRLLDKTSFDYPIRVLQEGVGGLPIFDIAEFGDSFGYEIIDIDIASTSRFKILGRDLYPAKDEIEFYLKEIPQS